MTEAENFSTAEFAPEEVEKIANLILPTLKLEKELANILEHLNNGTANDDNKRNHLIKMFLGAIKKYEYEKHGIQFIDANLENQFFILATQIYDYAGNNQLIPQELFFSASK